MEDLPPADRQVLALRDFAQLSVDETAARLGITPTAVTTRHLRAVRRLRGMLSCHVGDCS
jgi:RNA polymerase sigma factor (sigma-70 family)